MEKKDAILANEEQNRKKGLLMSIVLHLLLIFLCFMTFFNDHKKPTDQISGIIVQLGFIEGGNSVEEALSEATPSESLENVLAAAAAPIEEDKETVKEVVPEKEESVKEISPKTLTESQTLQEQSDILAKKEKEKANKSAQKKKAAEAKRAAKEKAKKEAVRKAAEEAKRKSVEEEAKKKAEYEAKKSKYGSLLSGGNGNNDNSGNQGDPDGDPNSKALENLATGSGSIGEGLSDRVVESKPVIIDNSQTTGKVVVDICINTAGKVISAKYTQKGSTSNDKELIEVAEKGVLKYRFSASNAAKQCGSVIIDFKLK